MIQVYLVKRYKRKRQRNGKREYSWALRWWEAPVPGQRIRISVG